MHAYIQTAYTYRHTNIDIHTHIHAYTYVIERVEVTALSVVESIWL